MALPYRTILRLPAEVDAVRLAEEEMRAWLSEKTEKRYRSGLDSGEYFNTGHHLLGTAKTLGTARIDHSEDGARRVLFKYDEKNATGAWQVKVLALGYSGKGRKRDVLLIEASRTDDPEAAGEVDPPRFVGQMLGREQVYDGSTVVTAVPHIVREEDVPEVLQTIVDGERSVSVVLAASVSPDSDEALKRMVAELTSKVVGVAAVFVLTQAATEMLNSKLPASHRVEPGRVRTYLPGVKLDDPIDGRRHRVLGPATFARAIRGSRVSRSLKAAYAREIREAMLAKPQPRDVVRAFQLLARVERESRIETRAKETNPAPGLLQSVRPASLLERMSALLSRWLKKDADAAPAESDLDLLDAYIAEKVATADTMMEEAVAVEHELVKERESNAEQRLEWDETQLELAEMQDEAVKLRRRVEFLQARLVEHGEYEDAYATVHSDAVWDTPNSVMELVEIISADSRNKHAAFEFVEFTGSQDAASEVQKRDQIGRYCASFWEYVQVLYDYAVARKAGFAGNVHTYLTDDRTAGKKCSPDRYAPNEGSLSKEEWLKLRVFPVPKSVDPSGSALMLAHFKTTQRDTFAPRLHFHDDTERSGKVYVGYIGRHLKNGHTKNS